MHVNTSYKLIQVSDDTVLSASHTYQIPQIENGKLHVHILKYKAYI